MALPAPAPSSTALVTGASSGIGSELARQLARRGHGVTLVARRVEPMQALARELAEAHGVRAEVIGCDLADPEARDALPAQVEALGLTVEVLVNNAGYGSAGAFTELDTATETQMVRLNCEAVVTLSSAFAPGMVARGRGAILVVASSAGFQPLPTQATYGASKAFALSFAEALHTELSGAGVAVTALCPGPVRTGFADVAAADALFDSAPGFAFVAPEEVARQALDGLTKNRRVVIPGLAIKAVAFGSSVTPKAILLPLMKRFYPH